MAGLRFPQHGGYCRAAAAMNLLLGVFHVLLPCFRPGEAQGQAIEPIPGVVELWQAEEGELLLPAQADSEEDVEEHPQEQSACWRAVGEQRQISWHSLLVQSFSKHMGKEFVCSLLLNDQPQYSRLIIISRA